MQIDFCLLRSRLVVPNSDIYILPIDTVTKRHFAVKVAQMRGVLNLLILILIVPIQK